MKKYNLNDIIIKNESLTSLYKIYSNNKEFFF